MDHQEEDAKLARRLRWIAAQQSFPERAPRWLATLVAAFQAMDVDEPEHDQVAGIIDAIEERLGIDGEACYDHVSEAGYCHG
jgi:hypothetical protein